MLFAVKKMIWGPQIDWDWFWGRGWGYTGEGDAEGAILTLLPLIVVTALCSRGYDLKLCFRARNVAGHSRNRPQDPKILAFPARGDPNFPVGYPNFPTRDPNLRAPWSVVSCLPTKLQETHGELGHLSKVVYAMFTFYKDFPGIPFWKVNGTRFSGRSNPVENFGNKSNFYEDRPIF